MRTSYFAKGFKGLAMATAKKKDITIDYAGYSL
jgi:hypothetical protein